MKRIERTIHYAHASTTEARKNAGAGESIAGHASREDNTGDTLFARLGGEPKIKHLQVG